MTWILTYRIDHEIDPLRFDTLEEVFRELRAFYGLLPAVHDPAFWQALSGSRRNPRISTLEYEVRLGIYFPVDLEPAWRSLQSAHQRLIFEADLTKTAAKHSLAAALDPSDERRITQNEHT